jgi:hypothetical protein
MRLFDVHGIEIMAPRYKVFEFVKQQRNLPHSAHAFVSSARSSHLSGPEGAQALDIQTSSANDCSARTATEWFTRRYCGPGIQPMRPPRAAYAQRQTLKGSRWSGER